MIHGTNVSGAFTTPKQVLPNLGGVYTYGIPLVIQDRTFVNDATTPPGPGFTGTPTPQTATVDPLWYNAGHTWVGGAPSVRRAAVSGTPTRLCRTRTFTIRAGQTPWPVGLRPLAEPGDHPHKSQPAEPQHHAGILRRYDDGQRHALSFRHAAADGRSLPDTHACDDRSLNLSLFKADPAALTEVKIVPATINPTYPTWPADGRMGGTVDPTTQGPSWIQIGNEAGFCRRSR